MDAQLLAILGPTASGKTDLALDTAHRHGGEIISADARQVYSGMDIGTDKATPHGRPEPQRRISPQDHAEPPRRTSAGIPRVWARDEPTVVDGIPHYLIDILTPDQSYSVTDFVTDATAIIGRLKQRGVLPIVVGGTGYYIRALTERQSFPAVSPDPAFRAWAETRPLEELATELRALDPWRAAGIDLGNRRRVVRALEIIRGSRRGGGPTTAGGRRGGASAAVGSSACTTEGCAPGYDLLPTARNILKLAFAVPPEELRRRIAERVDRQLRDGLVEEVRTLVRRYGERAPGLQAIAYREVFPHLRGEATLEDTRTAIIRANWQYARRQMTWMRREPNVVTVEDAAHARATIQEFLSL